MKEPTIKTMGIFNIHFFSICALFIFAVSAMGQRSTCVIGTTKFKCPENFKEVKSQDSSIRIFKHREAGDDLYFFISVLSGEFDPMIAGKSVLSVFPNIDVDKFKWKTVAEPLVMNVTTKYQFKTMASMGIGPSMLVEVKGFVFDIKGKKIVMGYVSDWSEAYPEINNRLFEKGKAFGDNARGCNAVVTALNSITREFKEKKQYCSLTAFGAPN